MFNSRHIHNHKTERVIEEITIHEHRAVTDASVSLLNEMQEKARLNLLDQVVVRTSFIEAVIMYHKIENCSGKILLNAKFKLNDKDYYVENFIDEFDLRTAGFSIDHNAAYKVILKSFVEVLAKEFSKEAMSLINKI